MTAISRRGEWAMRATMCALAVVTAGCQSIPDISDWNKATKDVTAAVSEGFQTSASINADISRRLGKVAEINPAFADPARRYAEVQKVLTTRADDYEKVFGAIADYSSALAAIARAADDRSKTVDAVAGSVQSLFSALGGGPLAGPAFELVKDLGAELILIKAARSFGDAVGKADPTIGKISDVVTKDLADLKKTVGSTKDEAIRAAIEEPYSKPLEYRVALERRRTVLQAAVRNTVGPTAQTTGSLLNAADAPELAKVEQYLRETDAWYSPMKSELDKALAAKAKSEELITQTDRAVRAWRESHASLSRAVSEQRPPDSGRLAALAIRIRALVDDLKKEK